MIATKGAATAPDGSSRRSSPPRPLGEILAGGLAVMGAQVRVDPHCDDNLVRRGRPGEPPFVVCAQGTPNLVHELGHVLWYGALEDDHGIDYRSIPYDMFTAGGGRLLVEELACTVLSCSYLRVEDADLEREGAWFAEQLEIQPVFYGCAGPAEFVATLEAWLDADERRARVDAACSELHERARRWLAGLGAARWAAIRPCTFDELWGGYATRRQQLRESRTSRPTG